MLLLTILICVVLLLLLIVWVTKSNAFSAIEHLKSTTLLLSIAQSFILSLQAGQILWFKLSSTSQQYTDFVTGHIVFFNRPKSIEYYALLFAIIVFVVSLLLILFVFVDIGEDKLVEQGIVKLSLYAMIPAAIMAGQSLRFANTIVLLNLSTLFVVLCLVIVGGLRFLLRKGVIAAENVFSVGSRIMLIVLFLVMSEIGTALLLPKLGVVVSKLLRIGSTISGASFSAPELGIVTYRFGVLTILLLILFSLLLFKLNGRMARFEDRLDLGLSLSQIGTPFLFSALLSLPVIYSTGIISFFHYRPALYITVLILALTAYLDLFQRFRNNKDNAIGRLVSPWVLFAILIYLHSYSTGWPSIIPDDYHFGEFYLPWWAFMKFGALPYVDLQPARGLVNYIPGLLSWLFYDNTFSGQSLINNLFSALYIFLAFFGLRKIVGDLVAFLSVASLFSYVGGPAGNLVMVVACLAILLKASYDKKYIWAFWLWVGFSIFVPLFSVAEGSSFVLGTLPLGIWLLLQAYRVSSKTLVISLILFLMAAVVVTLTTRLENVIISAVRYLMIEAGVNDAANGIPWYRPEGIHTAVTAGYLWQLIRFSWIFLVIPIVVRLVRHRNKMETTEQLFLVALFIICIILIPRAAGRIDVGSYSRPGLTSIVIIFCALPMVLIPPIRNDYQRIGAILLIALFFGLLGDQEHSAKNAKSLYRQVIYEPRGDNVIEKKDLYNIANNALMDKDQLKRQTQIKRVLDRILTPQETYFDTTNHAADYGFQGRKIPVSVPAIYNASSSSVQHRIVDQLKKQNIPLVFVGGEEYLFDGGVLSLRNYPIYKYLLDNYSPFIDEAGRFWMIRKGEENRLTNTPYRIGSDKEKLELLTSKFWQKDIQGLPAAWGNSVQSLNRKMNNPQDLLKNDSIESLNDLEQVGDDTWKVNGQDPYIVFSLPQGTKGELLLLEMSQNINNGSMQVFWESDLVPNFSDENSFSYTTDSSKYIIPVSAAPSWMQSNDIRKIRINFPRTYSGIIHFNTVSLLDRALE